MAGIGIERGRGVLRYEACPHAGNLWLDLHIYSMSPLSSRGGEEGAPEERLVTSKARQKTSRQGEVMGPRYCPAALVSQLN